jgi:hypothetical protein
MSWQNVPGFQKQQQIDLTTYQNMLPTIYAGRLSCYSLVHQQVAGKQSLDVSGVLDILSHRNPYHW